MTIPAMAPGRLAGWFCSLPLLVSLVSAAEPVSESASDLVRQALRAELAGDNQIRRERLEAAAALDPEFGPARWQQGKVRLPGQATWTSVRDAAVVPGEKWRNYAGMRDQYVTLPSVIWTENPGDDLRTFRYRFELPSRPNFAEIRLAGFHNLAVAVNGRELRLDSNRGVNGLRGIQDHLSKGINTLAIHVSGGNGSDGLIAWFGCTFPDNQIRSFVSGPSWETYAGPLGNWTGPFSSNDGWSPAIAVEAETETWENFRRPVLSPQLDSALAQWCGNRALKSQARFHWERVLAADPLNRDAIRALDLQSEDGLLWTKAELSERHETQRQVKVEQMLWSTKLDSLQKFVAARNQTGIQQFLNESETQLTALSSPILAQEAAESYDAEFAKVVCKLLDRTPDPAAAEGLVHVAVAADAEIVRKVALQQLRTRKSGIAAPFLLEMLHLPLQVQTRRIQQAADGRDLTTGQITFVDRRIDHDAVYQDLHSILVRPVKGFMYRVRAHHIDLNGDGLNNQMDLQILQRRLPLINAEMLTLAKSQAAETLVEHETMARAFADQINLQRDVTNLRIFAALEAVTGQSPGRKVASWWDWWIKCNSLSLPSHRGIKLTRRTSYGVQACEVRSAIISCFIAGTPVWTRQGLVPIEQIHAGDEVLSQDPDTGELAYKIVTFTTVRPPSPVLTLTAGGDSVTTTLGHRFWRTGSGWIMAKQVAAGVPLHRMDGSHPLDLVVPAGDAPAYNLVVDDFHTYFVGEAGWLVHDNRLPVPGNVLLPGLLAEPGEIVEAVPGCGLHKALINAAQGQVAK